MSNTIAYQGQTFLDKALESTGSVESAFEMSLLNGVSITDDVVIGSVLKTSDVISSALVAIYNVNNSPATGITIAQQQELDQIGIGFMKIESNFIIT